MIKAVVFDLDNTLVDFMKMKSQSIEAAISAMIDAGLNFTPEEVKSDIEQIYNEEGIEYQLVFDKLLLKYTDKIDHKVLSAGVVAYRRAKEAALVPYPHVNLTLIKLIKMGIKLGIVSDAPSKEAWLRISQLNLNHFFDHIITFDDTGERKPSPVPFKKILSLLNVIPSESIMVGDWAERDVVGAKQVGMKTAFAKYGDAFGTIHSHADYDLNDIMELIEIIQKNNFNG
jgi:putative hydrolase of the HAD superfamily